MLLSIIIPCYNEKERIRPTVEKVIGYLDGRGLKWEIIIVDDGSTDGTAEAIPKHEGIRVVSWKDNRGKGAAVRQGFMEASGDWILFTDADLSTPIEEADKLLALLPNYDIVIGSRDVSGKSIEKYQPPLRFMLGIAFGMTARLMFRIPYRDTQCGFKAMTSQSARRLAKHMRIDGFTFDLEMLAIARMMGLKVAEVGVRWKNVGGSKLKPRRDFPRILGELRQIRRNLREFKETGA